jgi:hypothetical protein
LYLDRSDRAAVIVFCRSMSIVWLRLKPRVRFALVAAAAFLVAGPADAASAVRNPTVEERGAIKQAIFDDVAARGTPAQPVIRRVRVSTVSLAAGRSRYRKFARVDLHDPKAGYAAALLGYFVASISGWRVLDLGSSEVGCSVPPRVFHGRKNAVLRDLRLDCP